ncbi:MAG TPA: ADOP family duplicated permease, partial [Longimicrobiales bacterium]|nr:ADOP family duplicated permease [Longimicrobiales bacterium]
MRRWLLRSLPSGARGASMVADLDEEYARLPPGMRRKVWYVWEAVRLAAHYRVVDWGGGHGVLGRGFRGGGEGTMRRFLRNMVHGLRRLRRDPVLGVVGAGTMALGVGATVAIFTVLNAVLLEPLPYENPEELVALFEADLDRGVDRNVANPGNALGWQDQAASLREVAGVIMPQPMVVEGAGDPREIMAAHVTPNLFSLLGMGFVLGRTFSPDAGGDGPGEIVLTSRFWTRTFGRDPGVLGTSVTVNGRPHEVVGVLSPGYVAFGDAAEFYRSLPLNSVGDQTSTGRFLWVLGRMTPGTTVPRLQAELDVVARNLEAAFPDFNAGWTVRAVPLRDDVVGDTATGLWVLLGSVGVLLLIACANVANLLLSRATERLREMAVRTSLGASGGDLFQLLVAESLVLAGAAGVLGVGLAYAGTSLLAERIPGAFALPRVAEAEVDGTVLLFSLAVVLVTGILFGIVPALEARRMAPSQALNAEGRGPSRRTGRLRSALVVGEVALSLALLVAGGLLVRSFSTLLAVDSGIRPGSVLTARANLTGFRYPDGESRARFFDEVLDRLRREPLVLAAGANTFLPMDEGGAGTSFRDFDGPVPPRDSWPAADIRNVAGEYFDAMGIELVEGRGFQDTDMPGTPGVIVVNRALADRMWPGADAVGKRLAINWGPLDEPWEVVGVVADVRLRGPEAQPRPTVYHHYPQAAYFPFMYLAVRTAGEPADFASRLREIVAEVDAGIPLGQPIPMEELVAVAVARPRMTTFLVGTFAAVAALL